MSTTSTASLFSLQGMLVEIAVKDPETQQDRVFRCALGPLRTHMRFFEPIIAKQVNEMKMAELASPCGTTHPFTLRAKCDHRTFEWLLDWMNGRAPAMTVRNIVSVTLSSNFLQMHALAEESLMYLRSHLSEMVTSSIDLMALPVDVVLRLSRIVRGSDLAAVLLHLYNRTNTAHPNRVFIASLLQHHVCYRLGLEGADGDGDDGAGGLRSDNAASANKKKTARRRSEGVQGGPNAVPTGDNASVGGGGRELVLRGISGLRWCRLCGTLFDEAEMQRLIRSFQVSAPECPAMAGESPAPPISHASPSSVPHPAGAATNGYAGGKGSSSSCAKNCAENNAIIPSVIRFVGPRGEVFTTHTESRHALPVVLDDPPLLKYDRSATTESIIAAAMRLERWAWRILGTTSYVSCRRCFHLVPLVEVPAHHCSSLPQRFASPDNVPDNTNYLVRWFVYCAEQDVYADEGGLTPIQFDGPSHVLAEEVVTVPVALKSLSATPSSKAIMSGAGGKDEIVCGARKNQAPAVGGGKMNAAAWSGIAGAPPTPPMSFWATKPFYVAEVMDKGIVDIDIQNYVERQHRFIVEGQQRRASALFNPPHMRLASSSMVAQASSSTPSPRLFSNVSGASNSTSLSRGKVCIRPTRIRGNARSPYGM
ncbi:hypothetical protein ABL78_1414 [Leptomonas seymouri]|uniref:SANT and BTB domain-containing protein n=1 Tax=Leptomonas seymouri TaxID=5684 RepID=A0A0N1I7G4_LEPSE|nr:hypothetical protein ABL78_1414 [Leptomonas seymouri]|eukprot:KPI89450.1 hypothetical protein ABL78_1414 [Leptomonas seymouri]